MCESFGNSDNVWLELIKPMNHVEQNLIILICEFLMRFSTKLFVKGVIASTNVERPRQAFLHIPRKRNIFPERSTQTAVADLMSVYLWTCASVRQRQHDSEQRRVINDYSANWDRDHPAAFQVFPLTKNGEICHFHHRYTSTVREKKSTKSHCIIFA